MAHDFNNALAVMLSYAAWQRRYGGRQDVLGQTVTLDGSPNTIIAVLPPDFHFAPAGSAEFWTALHAKGACADDRGCHGLSGVARLSDGVSLQTASADMTSINRLPTTRAAANSFGRREIW